MTSSDTLPLSEDQQALQDTLRGFLAEQLPPAALRAALETRPGYRAELHARLAGEFGLAGLRIPREFGGRGPSQVEASVVNSELGRALYPGPLLSTALASGMLLAAGDRAAQGGRPPRLADGSVIGTVAAADEGGHWVFGPDSVRAERAPGGWRLYGHRRYVLGAHAADVVAVPAVTEACPGCSSPTPGPWGALSSGQLGLDLTSISSPPSTRPGPTDRGGEGRAPRAGTAGTDSSIAHRLQRQRRRVVPGRGHRLCRSRQQVAATIGAFQGVAACVDILAPAFPAGLGGGRRRRVSAADGGAKAPKAAHAAALRAGEALPAR